MLSFSSDIAALAERLRPAIREHQADAEILIAWVQLAIVLLFSLVYAAAPKAFPEMSRFEPVPLVLGAYIAITLSQLGLSYLRRGVLLGAFVVVDVVLLLVLIWSFHIQYMQPPSFSLKAPTLLSVFIFIALRALRVDAGYVLLAGFVAAAGWTALVAYALAESLPGAITHASSTTSLPIGSWSTPRSRRLLRS
jgi:adenylate cyclase